MDISQTEKRESVAAEHYDHTKANAQQLHDAQAANAEEHNTTLKQALRENWKAVLWSSAISLTIVMEGYDQSLMSNFFGYPTFQRKFGSYVRIPSSPIMSRADDHSTLSKIPGSSPEPGRPACNQARTLASSSVASSTGGHPRNGVTSLSFRSPLP